MLLSGLEDRDQRGRGPGRFRKTFTPTSTHQVLLSSIGNTRGRRTVPDSRREGLRSLSRTVLSY